MEDKLYLDDLSVGDTFSSGEYQLAEEEIISFATQYDPQYFHIDTEAAENTFFQGLAASGWNTAAITMKLIVESVPLAHGIIGAGVDLNWPNPTRPGDILTVKSTIKAIHPSRSKPNQAILICESHTTNQNNDVLQITSAKLLSFKKEV